MAVRAASASECADSSALEAPGLTARIQPDNLASIAVATAVGMEFAFNTVAQPGVLVAVYRAAKPMG